MGSMSSLAVALTVSRSATGSNAWRFVADARMPLAAGWRWHAAAVEFDRGSICRQVAEPPSVQGAMLPPAPVLPHDWLPRALDCPAAPASFSCRQRILGSPADQGAFLAPTNRCHIDGDETSNRAIAPTVTRQVRDFRARNLILAWHTGDVRTRAANPTSFHDGCPSSRLRHMPSDKLAAHPAAEDERRDDDGEICAILRTLILARIASRRCRKTSLPRRRRRD
jgi:hypothetical protein